ncbi:MAG: D-alanyl-D-alanine carboxypeptidase family protein [Peptostreptococcaceae bacterium]
MIKKVSILLAFALTFVNLFAFNNVSFAETPQPNISAQYAVLMDYTSGKILYEKNPHQKMYPASTTKVWTAYVTLKHIKNLDEVITVGNIGNIEGSSMYLVPGEKLTVRQLLEGLLIVSANDAAVVLAERVSGSVPEFAKLMNEEAKKIGAVDTHFNNANGLPDLDHYTSAYDMALMAREAMSNEVFREIVSTKMLRIPATGLYPERFMKNSNKFLTGGDAKMPYKGQMVDIQYDIVDGIKTGFTDDAGKCLLSSAKKDDMRLISAVFKANGDIMYVDSRTLLDYGFDNFRSEKSIDNNDFLDSKSIWYSKERKLNFIPKYSYYTVISKTETNPTYTTKTKLNDIKLPIKKGATVGTLEVYKDGESKAVAHIPLIAQNDVHNLFKVILNNKIVKTILSILTAGLGLVILFVVLVLARKKARRNKRKQLMYNKRKNIYSGKNKKIYSNKKKNIYSNKKSAKRRRR